MTALSPLHTIGNQIGALDAERVRAGEWWRAVTSLWLHADAMHVFGNAVAAVVFVV